MRSGSLRPKNGEILHPSLPSYAWICVIPWSELKGVDRAQLQQSWDAMKEVWSGFGMDARTGDHSFDAFKAWGLEHGIPAWRKSVKEGDEEASESTLTSITKGAIPRSAFEPPAGFTKKDIGMGKE